MDDFIKVLELHTKEEEKKFNSIEEMISKHVDEDYPKVIEMLHRHEHILHEISGGMKVLKFIGWLIASLGGMFVFFKDHLFHLGK